jgi:hypothetical protein
MKAILFAVLVVLLGCSADKTDQFEAAKKDKASIEQRIAEYHDGIRRAYHGEDVSTDKLLDEFFVRSVYYVTYWGSTEPLDSTKARLKRFVGKVSNFESRYEGLTVRVYGDGAFAFFIQRQSYSVNGKTIDEYLPTTYVLERRDGIWMVVHAQRSADFQTIQQQLELSRIAVSSSEKKDMKRQDTQHL